MIAPLGQNTQRNKTKGELQKNAVCYFKQILEAAPVRRNNDLPNVRHVLSHLSSHYLQRAQHTCAKLPILYSRSFA